MEFRLSKYVLREGVGMVSLEVIVTELEQEFLELVIEIEKNLSKIDL